MLEAGPAGGAEVPADPRKDYGNIWAFDDLHQYRARACITPAANADRRNVPSPQLQQHVDEVFRLSILVLAPRCFNRVLSEHTLYEKCAATSRVFSRFRAFSKVTGEV